MNAQPELVEVFLVPGFLGFQQLNDLPYFIDVDGVLRENLAKHGIQAEVHALGTKVPAGSLRLRTAYLAREVAKKHSPNASSVHFVGHSTGGLDIRLLLSPGNTIESGEDLLPGGILDEGDELDLAELDNLRDALDKTRSAISVATPHYGTPIANAAMRLAVDRRLQDIRRILGRPGVAQLLAAGLSVAGAAGAMVQPLLPSGSFAKWIVTKVLTKSPDELIAYLKRAGADVGALRNLTQEGMDVADSLLIPRSAVGYGSILTGTREPGYMVHTKDLLLLTATVFFRIAWAIVAGKNPNYPYTKMKQEVTDRYEMDARAGLDVGELDIDNRTSDGVVPTLSQAFGTILGVFASDHLDCVGHFPHVRDDGSEVPGWVRSGAKFSPARFALLWGRVGDFVASVISQPDRIAPPDEADRLRA